MNKIFEIITLGCKVNQSESAGMTAQLKAGGYSEVGGHSDATGLDPSANVADVCIINTCTVTEKASMQSRQAIRRAMRRHPNARIIVTGCYAQTQPEEIEKIAGVHDIVGRCDKHCIADRILSDTPGPNCYAPSGVAGSGRSSLGFFSEPPDFSGRTRAFLKIQDGCNANCTYCIVPRARGLSRSMPLEQVLDNLRKLRFAGYQEVVLSGIHLGCYGKDLRPTTDLTALLDRIELDSPTGRIRLSSIEPGELSDRIITRVAQSERLCHHFHIPLQSGDDWILKKMGRPYSRSFFRDLVLKIHDRLPHAAIGLDTLIGFPGETDTAFQQTYELVDSLPITYLHVFPFSPRAKTPASRFPDRIPAHVTKERCRRMRALGHLKKQAFYEKLIGQVVPVLVEGKKDLNTGRYKGTTSNYVPVFLTGAEDVKNCIVEARIEESAGERGVLGRVMRSPSTS